MRPHVLLYAGVAALMGSALGVLPAQATAPVSAGPAGVHVRPSAARFTHGQVTNRWFPLKPGTRTVYRGVDGADPVVDVVTVTRHTKTIQGVTCRTVHDRLFSQGHLTERTSDWYAQTKRGTVWYFGERTAELDAKGHVTTREGSWMTGRDGARPGIFMTAHPRVGQTHQQEDFPGHAEDRFRIIDTAAAVRVPILATQHALLTKEWTPLEPGVVDHKYYVRDLGVVREVTVKGPTESLKLFSVRFLR
jgi:hypothetical protein